jgi:UDP-N-acetylglucosamine acyltransferase
MARVHPHATVDPSAKLAEDAEVGPYSFIGPDVELASGVVVGPQATIVGRTTVGARTRVFPFAVIGGEPQDRGFNEVPGRLVIGADNVIREHVTISVGTAKGGVTTRLGDDNLIMNTVHIGHDCQIGSHCILASFSGLAGHVTVEDYAVLGGYTGVHQFVRIGESVMCAADSKVGKDAPPFSLVHGNQARWVGLNTVGLKRRGFSAELMSVLKRAFHILYRSSLRTEPALARMRDELGHVPEVERLVRFLEGSEKRGFVR